MMGCGFTGLSFSTKDVLHVLPIRERQADVGITGLVSPRLLGTDAIPGVRIFDFCSYGQRRGSHVDAKLSMLRAKVTLNHPDEGGL